MHCWFCDRPQAEVNVLITGSGTAICDQCISECVDLLSQRPTGTPITFRADRERRQAAELLERAGNLATEALTLLKEAQART